jgi:uncharacterized protein
MDRHATLRALIAADSARMRVLAHVRVLGLPDCWVAAGFVRSSVWDHLHGRPPALAARAADVDVVWHDPDDALPARDAALEAALRGRDGTLAWSVKNQARMHARNGDAPYASATDAMRHWPETATAVGVRLARYGTLDVAAPFGLDDLFGLVVRPTPRFMAAKYPLYLERLRAKDWRAAWPGLAFVAHG